MLLIFHIPGCALLWESTSVNYTYT